MKLLLALTVLPMVALSATLSPLPPSEYADTEVATNIPVVVDFDTMNRLELALSLVPLGDAGELVEVRERLFGLLLWVR